jgi:hypothetical protein
MSPTVETAIVAAIIGTCGIYLLRSAMRSGRRLFGRNGSGGACGGGCGGGCSTGSQDRGRRPVTIEKIARR